MTSEEEAFERWHDKQVHLKGTRKIRDKAIVAAMDKAIEALLIGPSGTVNASSIQAWIFEHLKFGDSIVSQERIDEHCLYQAGKPGAATRTFQKPKANAALRVIREGVYGLTNGKSWYEYEQRRHGNKQPPAFLSLPSSAISAPLRETPNLVFSRRGAEYAEVG